MSGRNIFDNSSEDHYGPFTEEQEKAIDAGEAKYSPPNSELPITLDDLLADAREWVAILERRKIDQMRRGSSGQEG